MEINEQLKTLLSEIQKPANVHLIQIIEIKKILIQTQNYDDAIIVNKIEKSLLEFISLVEPITKLERTTRITEIFKTKS